ncbi:MAG: bifunctional phosphoglucose/phosphomannose isomerase [Candidatus Woesearchaeota archaeon]
MVNLDKSNIRQVILDMPKHIVDAISIVKDFKVDALVNSVIITGMGGSAIAGDVLKTYLSDITNIRIEVNRAYELPRWADDNTLVIVSSYSGNTEETVSAYRDAIRKKCKIMGVVTGGKLKELFNKNNHPLLLLPKGLQPRNAICYSFFTMLKVMENSGFIPKQTAYIKETINALKKPMLENAAKDLAKSLVGKIPLIYASERLNVVAYRWKSEFNENSKIHAFSNILPEFNHNELVGYTKKLADFHVIFLKDQDDNKHIKKRININKSLIKKAGVPVTEIGISGPDRMTRLFSAIFMGDMTSYYLALEYGIDPAPVEIIENLKLMLKE